MNFFFFFFFFFFFLSRRIRRCNTHGLGAKYANVKTCNKRDLSCDVKRVCVFLVCATFRRW
jgi:hypothetical protein